MKYAHIDTFYKDLYNCAIAVLSVKWLYLLIKWLSHHCIILTVFNHIDTPFHPFYIYI